ncbi:MAG: molybdenum ABC transporter ATP-binding protein [Parasutterella sp.]
MAKRCTKAFSTTWERPLGYVFQEASLFPHMTAKQNIEFAVKRSKSADARSRMEEAIDLLGIRGLLGRKPAQLSGGERQRVAIARAVATEPKIMLFDEPLAALDFKRKSEIMPWLEKLKGNLKIPMLYVTHSAEEVLHLADNLIVMEDGKIKTSGALTDVLANIDLPIKIGEDAGVLLKGKVVSKEPEWSLMTVDCGNIALHISDNGQPVGSAASLRILAREVVFAIDRPVDLSVQNAFEGTVEEISIHGDGADALVRTNCSGQIIIGKLTRKALSELGIKEVSRIWLLIKSVAVLSV